MQRMVILALAVLALALGATLAYVLLRGPHQAPPMSIDAADENASEPLRQEMTCIDQLLQDRNLRANEVEPALARCEGGPSGNQSNGQ